MIGTKKAVLRWLIDQPEDEYEVKKHKPKRSLTANAYFHRLVGLLAEGESARFYEKKNELIMQYGNRQFVRAKDGTPEYALLPDDDSWKSNPQYHYVPSQFTDDFCGKPMRAFLLLKGTHTYDSKEMAHLIECTRNECLGSGIPLEEVETPEERRLFERLKK